VDGEGTLPPGLVSGEDSVVVSAAVITAGKKIWIPGDARITRGQRPHRRRRRQVTGNKRALASLRRAQYWVTTVRALASTIGPQC
jgi:hypothetical protein